MTDYISREAAIEYLTLNMGWHDEDGYPVDDWDERKAHIADLINGIPAADVRPKWISVEERLPEAGQRVLCYCRANIYEVMKMRTDGRWVANDMVLRNSFVTHWMPLPEAPKMEVEK